MWWHTMAHSFSKGIVTCSKCTCECWHAGKPAYCKNALPEKLQCDSLSWLAWTLLQRQVCCHCAVLSFKTHTHTHTHTHGCFSPHLNFSCSDSANPNQHFHQSFPQLLVHLGKRDFVDFVDSVEPVGEFEQHIEIHCFSLYFPWYKLLSIVLLFFSQTHHSWHLKHHSPRTTHHSLFSNAPLAYSSQSTHCHL